MREIQQHLSAIKMTNVQSNMTNRCFAPRHRAKRVGQSIHRLGLSSAMVLIVWQLFHIAVACMLDIILRVHIASQCIERDEMKQLGHGRCFPLPMHAETICWQSCRTTLFL